jgi:hypothetical protein
MTTMIDPMTVKVVCPKKRANRSAAWPVPPPTSTTVRTDFQPPVISNYGSGAPCVPERVTDRSDGRSSTRTRVRMMAIEHVLAVVPVSDLERADAWYEALFGRPADNQPMPSLVEGQVTGAGWVQVTVDTDRAGSGLLNLAVDDPGEALRAPALESASVSRCVSGHRNRETSCAGARGPRARTGPSSRGPRARGCGSGTCTAPPDRRSRRNG